MGLACDFRDCMMFQEDPTEGIQPGLRTATSRWVILQQWVSTVRLAWALWHRHQYRRGILPFKHFVWFRSLRSHSSELQNRSGRRHIKILSMSKSNLQNAIDGDCLSCSVTCALVPHKIWQLSKPCPVLQRMSNQTVLWGRWLKMEARIMPRLEISVLVGRRFESSGVSCVWWNWACRKLRPCNLSDCARSMTSLFLEPSTLTRPKSWAAFPAEKTSQDAQPFQPKARVPRNEFDARP